MNYKLHILFLSLSHFNNINAKGIYMDLIRALVHLGNSITVCAPLEQREKKSTYLEVQNGVKILRIRVGNITKCKNFIEKGMSLLFIESQYKNALEKFTSNEKYDLVLYATPPITFVNVVKYVKKRDGAKSYLMLKDIFPQNAIDLGMLSTRGVKGLLYHYFRNKEKVLYAISDHIGCMSPANVTYVLQHNPEVIKEKVAICPNSLEVEEDYVSPQKDEKGYKTFLYGGNLGKPQDIPFLIECLKMNMNLSDRKFIICGTGTELTLLQRFMIEETPKNILLIPGLSKEKYSTLVEQCDVGLIFLDHRFTIPNFPSRILSYMEKGIPILAVTDPYTDMGKIIEMNKFGWWCESSNSSYFKDKVNNICDYSQEELKKMGQRGREFLKYQYNVNKIAQQILDTTFPNFCT